LNTDRLDRSPEILHIENHGSIAISNENNPWQIVEIPSWWLWALPDYLPSEDGKANRFQLDQIGS